MDCFSDASLEPTAIAVYNPDVLRVYLVLYTPYGGQPGMSLFFMFFESLFEGSFRFAYVTGFTVVTCQLIYYTTFVLVMVLVFWGH